MRTKENNKIETYTKQVQNNTVKQMAIQNSIKFDNSQARAQYKRNLDNLRKQQMDKMFSRKQRLIDLQKQEEKALMAEFEEMKRQEQLAEFDAQAKLIEEFKAESAKNHEAVVQKAQDIRVATSNEVRQEKMALENVKTATQNKFSKAYIEHAKAVEDQKEKRFYDMQLLDNHEKENLVVAQQELRAREKNTDQKNALVNQMQENTRIREFNLAKEKKQQAELTALEEEQIGLEKKLEREKKNVTRNFLLRTIEENKVKIAAKKEALLEAKQAEQQRMKALEAEIEEEKRVKKITEAEHKRRTKEQMAHQLKLQEKAKADVQELDRLAQVAQDERNAAFDAKEQRTQQLRSTFQRDMLIHNQEQLKNKQWHRALEDKQTQDEKVEVAKKVNNWAVEDNNVILEGKQQRSAQMQELKKMMAVQQVENDNAKVNNLKMEKKLLEDASKFDTFVTDIVQMKRQFLDKLREQRPF